jgi:p-cumate 2,3-dioxygenase beta subunit
MRTLGPAGADRRVEGADVIKPSRKAIEDFLFDETAFYHIPALDNPQAGPQDSLSLVADNMVRLRSRVRQLTGRSMWAENPLSRTRRLISNVRVLSADEGGVQISANFAVHRMRHQAVDIYVGRYLHRLTTVDGGFKFLERKAVLDLETLNPHGKISILL